MQESDMQHRRLIRGLKYYTDYMFTIQAVTIKPGEMANATARTEEGGIILTFSYWTKLVEDFLSSLLISINETICTGNHLIARAIWNKKARVNFFKDWKNCTNLRIRVIYGLSCFSFTGILFIYKNRYTPLNTVTYWLVSLFVTFEINFGSNSLEGLHLVISRFAHAQMFYPSIDTNNWSRSVPRMVHAWEH